MVNIRGTMMNQTMNPQPLITVKDVESSSRWSVLEFTLQREL